MTTAPHRADDEQPVPREATPSDAAKHKPWAALRARYRTSFWQGFFHELNEVEFFDQTILLAAGLLISLVPFFILVSAFASQRVDDDIALRLGLDHRAGAIVSGLFRSSSASFDAGTAITLLILLAGAVTVSSSFQLIYEKIFHLNHRRSLYRLLTWTAALSGALVIESLVGRPVRNEPGGLGLVELVTIALFTPFYWWTMHFLLAGRVGWRRLLPSAVATGVFYAGLGVFSSFYFSSTIISDSKTYGPIGAVLSIVTWLIAISSVIILGAAAGSVWYDRRR